MTEVKALTDEQVEAAVDWWAGALKSPKFDNGDNSRNGGMAMMMATMLVEPVPDEALESFKEELAKSLREERPYCIMCDYGPGGFFADAIDKSGVNPSNFPWKTAMWFEDGGVQVSYGYGAPEVELLQDQRDNT